MLCYTQTDAGARRLDVYFSHMQSFWIDPSVESQAAKSVPSTRLLTAFLQSLVVYRSQFYDSYDRSLTTMIVSVGGKGEGEGGESKERRC